MSKRSRPRDQRQPKTNPNRRWIIIGAIVIAALVIFGILIYPSISTPPVDTSTPVANNFKPVPNPNGFSMGKADAPVKVEEYSDFQCPYCKQYFTDLEPSVIEKYVTPGKVVFIYNPFSFIGEESKLAAEAAFCAADQNKFWPMHYLIFSSQGTENSGIFTKTSLSKLASQAGLDIAKFHGCFDNGSKSQSVEDANTAAMGRKVESTPSFFVNGKGPLSMNELMAEIDKAVAGSN
jgi:protein-disulfide isomerase